MTKKWGQFHWKSVLESNKYYSWNQCYWLIQSQPENGTSLSSVGPNPCQSDNIPPCWMAFLITLTSSEIKTKKFIRILQKTPTKMIPTFMTIILKFQLLSCIKMIPTWCISPIEMIRTKLQSRKEFSYKGIVHLSCITYYTWSPTLWYFECSVFFVFFFFALCLLNVSSYW